MSKKETALIVVALPLIFLHDVLQTFVVPHAMNLLQAVKWRWFFAGFLTVQIVYWTLEAVIE